MISLILTVFAFVIFVLGGLAVPDSPWRTRLIAWGLACWVLAEIVKTVPNLK